MRQLPAAIATGWLENRVAVAEAIGRSGSVLESPRNRCAAMEVEALALELAGMV
jgi:hypothetical protein